MVSFSSSHGAFVHPDATLQELEQSKEREAEMWAQLQQVREVRMNLTVIDKCTCLLLSGPHILCSTDLTALRFGLWRFNLVRCFSPSTPNTYYI